jgi:hypothetical protein
MKLLDLALSVGLFAVAIPASSLLTPYESNSLRRVKCPRLAILLAAVVVILSLTLIFSNTAGGGEYIGFENVTVTLSLRFLVTLFISILMSLIYLLNSIRAIKWDQVFDHWPILFHFAACGLGLALAMQSSLGVGLQTDATIVL